MSTPEWYVVNEYETFNNPEPKHAWTLIGVHVNKKDAELQALDVNFDLYAKNYRERWPKEMKSLEKPTRDERYKIVCHIIKNINAKTGSVNNWLGTGCWITSALKFAEAPNCPMNIPDIHTLLPQPVASEKGEEDDGESSESSLGEDDS